VADILLVSLGSTAGLRAADVELGASLRRAGADVAEVAVELPSERRTFALHDLAQARAAQRATRAALAEHGAAVLLYSSITAALLWPAPGAVRFDAPAAGNRPGRHGLWQRPLERRRLAAAPVLVPWSAGGLGEAPAPRADAVVVPVPVEPSAGPAPARDLAAVAYGADAPKKGLDRILDAWSRARRPDEELVVAGTGAEVIGEGVTCAGLVSPGEFRELLRRARTYVAAPRREDYGIAQLEALADGAMLVTTPAPGPYAALPIARRLDPRLVSDDLGSALRAALDDPAPGYAEAAEKALTPYRRAAVDRTVADELLPRLLGPRR
jgi:glycosyltransferase involved in cell wall biosynthesis